MGGKKIRANTRMQWNEYEREKEILFCAICRSPLFRSFAPMLQASLLMGEKVSNKNVYAEKRAQNIGAHSYTHQNIHTNSKEEEKK